MRMDSSEIIKFFENQTVFMTGGTGFLGKVLVEKLLRVCPGLKMVYLLVRSKKGKTDQERFDALFESPCFDLLKSMNVDYKSRVRLIRGDCERPDLGLSLADEHTLLREVTCVIHAAANVRFNQTLREAAQNNVRPLRILLDMAKRMDNLKVFVYVSTAFSNCVHSHIKEQFYEPPMRAEVLFSIVDGLDDETLEKITPHILKKWPNTYVFSKAIAENLLKTQGQGLPIVLIRPPVVTATAKEPHIGWVDNLYGPVGLMIAASLGILKSLHCDPATIFWFAPVDYVANAIMAVAWYKGTQRHNVDDGSPMVFNCIISKTNLISWKTVKVLMEKCLPHFGSEKAIWHYCLEFRKNYVWHTVCAFLFETIPAYLADFVLICLGKPALAVKNYAMLHNRLTYVSYFNMNFWDFDFDNLRKVWHGMEETDQKLFNFNGDDMDMDEYSKQSAIGARLYVLKEPLDNVQKAIRRLKILKVVHYTVLTIIWFLLYKLFMFSCSSFF